MASSPVSKPLAEIRNKRWGSKLSDNKLKELSEKYDLAVGTYKLWALVMSTRSNQTQLE